MSDPKCARVLIEAADRDLSALRGMIDEEVFADEVIGFHAQQAVEKLLKAWLALRGEEYPITHNLAQLLDALQAHEMEAVGYRDLIALNPYAVRLRYVGQEPETPGVDREAVVGRIESLMERVQWQLNRSLQ